MRAQLSFIAFENGSYNALLPFIAFEKLFIQCLHIAAFLYHGVRAEVHEVLPWLWSIKVDSDT